MHYTSESGATAESTFEWLPVLKVFLDHNADGYEGDGYFMLGPWSVHLYFATSIRSWAVRVGIW